MHTIVCTVCTALQIKCLMLWYKHWNTFASCIFKAEQPLKQILCCCTWLDKEKKKRLNFLRRRKYSKVAAIIIMFHFAYQLNLGYCSLCVYHWPIQDTSLWIQYSKLLHSKTLDPPLLIVTTVLILQATGILWSSCCKLSELSFTSQCL